MATQITKTLTQLRWYAPNLAVSAAPWLSSVNIVRVVNPAGSGYGSYQSGQQFNSYTTLTTGDIVTVEALPAAISGSGFSLDNGVQALTSRLIATFPPNATAFLFPITLTAADQPGVYNLEAANPIAGLTNLAYQLTPSGGSIATTTLPVTLAVGDTLTITATTGSTAGTITLLK